MRPSPTAGLALALVLAAACTPSEPDGTGIEVATPAAGSPADRARTAQSRTAPAAAGESPSPASASESPSPAPASESPAPAARAAEAELAPISVSGSYWIELAPVIVAAESFYPDRLLVGEGGITRITAGEVDLATNAETQLLRESLVNEDLRIIMTVTESFYRLVARRSAGIESLADLKGKRIMVPRRTSANYFLVAMLATVGLTEDDVELVGLPAADDVKLSLDAMSDALLNGDADAISIWEPEPADAIEQLGDDAIVFQDRSIYREVFNLHASATALADPSKRRSIVAFVRAVAAATEALDRDPAPYWPEVSRVIGYSEAEIEAGWPEMEFPIRIVPDMLDVLETEEKWVATERDREPRSREALSRFIDRSVVEEALAGR
jgi:NitT/TauT family transport system substrate-binding protein